MASGLGWPSAGFGDLTHSPSHNKPAISHAWGEAKPWSDAKVGVDVAAPLASGHASWPVMQKTLYEGRQR
jgi:hypothetical protein